jgi:tetratricopeptide (TPR) repeat protein
MRIASFVSVLLIGALSFSSIAAAGELPPSSAEVQELQKQARASMRSLEYEQAVPLLLRALAAKDLGLAQKAELNAALGICHANLGDTARSRDAFEAALSADPLLDLPVGTAPKIRQLFEGVRAQRRAARTAVGSASVELSAESPSMHLVPLDYIVGSVAVAGLAAGIAAGAASSKQASDLQNGIHDRSTADSLSSKRQTYAAISVASYGVAGAAALAELAIILFVNHRSEPAHPQPTPAVSVSGSILPAGASASLQVRF